MAFSLRVGQSKPIYEAYRALRDGPEWDSLSEAQQRIVEAELREATLSGVALEGKEKERFNEIQQVWGREVFSLFDGFVFCYCLV